jgi:hypothetical protein
MGLVFKRVYPHSATHKKLKNKIKINRKNPRLTQEKGVAGSHISIRPQLVVRRIAPMQTSGFIDAVAVVATFTSPPFT